MTAPTPAGLWVVDLDDRAAPDGDDLARGLSDEDLARGAALATELARRRWLLTRYATRALLGAALGVAPGAVALERAASGKPFVAGGPCFNVAHSGHRALVAVSAAGEVGVDVEHVRTGLREEAILARVVGAGAAARWSGAPEESRTALFFDEWVRFEAAVKCRGATLAGSFGADVAAGLVVERVDVGPGYAGAVAAEAAAPAAARYAWA